jgi:hypothetical protein
MSFHNSTKVLGENAEAFFSCREANLDLLFELCKNRQQAKKALEKARANNPLQLHNSSQSRIKHMSCAEDFNYKEMLVYRCIELIK